MNKTVLLGAIGAAVTVAALAINYAVTWQDAAVEPVAIEPGDAAQVADTGDAAPAAQPGPTAPAAIEAELPAAGETATAALEVEAEPKAPVASGATPTTPEFDIVRINPSGDGVIGGRAAPGSLVTLYRDGRAVESITADDRGEWVMLPGVGVLNGAREISLSAQLPGQPELLSEQVVTIAVPDPSAGAGQTPLVMLVPRGGTGAQTPAPTGLAAPAPADLAPPMPAAETAAETAAAETAAAETAEVPAVQPAPAGSAESVATIETPAETAPAEAAAAEAAPAEAGPAEVAPAEAAAASTIELPAGAADATPGQLASTDVAVEAGGGTPSQAAEETMAEGAAAESAAAALLELPGLFAPEATGTTGGASDTAAAPQDSVPEPVAPAEAVVEDFAQDSAAEEAVGGGVAEGRAAELMAAIEPPALPETAPTLEGPPVVAVAPVVEEAPQRMTGAGVDSASSEPLVAAAVADRPPARIGAEDNNQLAVALPLPAAEPPAAARNVPDLDGDGAALDVAVSRDAGPGADLATVVPEAVAEAVRPEVTENITVTEIMIELKWSRPVVAANEPAGEIVADAALTVVPETPAPFRIAALPVLTDAPSGPLWTEAQSEPVAYPGDPIRTALPALPVALDMAELEFAALPSLEPTEPAPVALPARAVAAPEEGPIAAEIRPETVQIAALQPAVLPATWTLREPALEALPSLTPDAVIPAPGDIGGRAPLAPVVAAPAGLDLLDSASYQSTNPAAAEASGSLDAFAYQSTNPTVDEAAAAGSAISPLDAATYQSTSPSVGGGVAAGGDAGVVGPADSVDALIAEAKSALDAATRAEQALNGEDTATEAAPVPAVLPDAPAPISDLPALAGAADRPGEAWAIDTTARPSLAAGDAVPPADWEQPQASIEVAAVETGTAEAMAEMAASETVAAEAEGTAAETAAADPSAAEIDAAESTAQADVTPGVTTDALTDATPAVEEFEIAVAMPAPAVAEVEIVETGLDLGSFRRDDGLTAGAGAYDGLDSETLRGEGIRSGSVALQSVEYDERGEVVIGGTATPNAPLNVYVDNVHVGSAVAGAEGEWTVVPDQPLSEGLHYLRVDQVEEGGRVVARVESPFVRVEPIAVTAGGARVVVQPGNSLWRIARRTLADGTRFTAIYEANKSQITDPNMIYPGQVFVVPSAQGTN